MPTSHATADARTSWALAGVVLFYVGVLLAMVAFNRYVFLLKSLIVPVLLLVALLAGRFQRFVNDWAVFLGAIVFFDFCRGLAFAVTSRFELPMYLGYVLTWERWLCGGAIAPVSVQRLRASLTDPVWVDRFFVLVYSSHFLVFLLLGFAIWHVRRDAFRTYAAAILALMYAGLLGYFLVPTVPPWAAANEFLVLPPIVQLVRSFYNVHVPQLLAAFDVNPIAAMPSLHAALPALCALLACRYVGRAGLLVGIYAVAVWAAVIYLGEHYLVDVVAGGMLALAVYAGVGWWEAGPSPATPDGRQTARRRRRGPPDRWAVRPITIALLLIAGAVGFGQLTARWIGALPITRAFVERELIGRSKLAHYYLGRIAFAEGDFAAAQAALTRALDEEWNAAQERVIRTVLGNSAARNRDYPAVIAALAPLRPAAPDADSLVLLANAYVETDQYETGVAVLREARSRFPAEPAPLYWLARHQYLRGEIDRGNAGRAIDALGRLPREQAEPFRRSLLELVRTGRAPRDDVGVMAPASHRWPAAPLAPGGRRHEEARDR